MSDIADLLPTQSPTVAAIFAAYKRAGDAEQPRGYLGASSIGASCERALWYQFRFCCRPEFDGRMYRLFATGDLEEARFVADLRAIGCEVHDVGEDGQQFAVEALGGHFSGHMDGCALGIPEAHKTWHVTEFKTHNAKSFAKLQKNGVKSAKPQHYAQMQVYMHLTGMTRAIYLARNKDTDDLYAERVHYDREYAESLIARAERIITTTTPPERIASRPDWYECQWCDAKKLCWGDPAGPALPIPAINCRQCCHATPKMDGQARWECEKHRRSLSPADQTKACDDHLVLPGLIESAQPVDASPTWIDFQDHDPDGEAIGDIWRCGQGGFSTRELMTLPAAKLTSGMLSAAKGAFNMLVTGYMPNDILARYPESDSRVIWKGETSELLEVWKERYGEDMTALTPIAQCECDDYKAAEFSGGRVAILWTWVKQKWSKEGAEIREGVE